MIEHISPAANKNSKTIQTKVFLMKLQFISIGICQAQNTFKRNPFIRLQECKIKLLQVVDMFLITIGIRPLTEKEIKINMNK